MKKEKISFENENEASTDREMSVKTNVFDLLLNPAINSIET